MRFAREQSWWTSRPFRDGRLPISVFSKPYSAKAVAFRLWAPSAASKRSASLFSVSYIGFLAKRPSGKKIGPTLNKVSKPLILVHSSHFINVETEVQGGVGSDLSQFIGPISKRAEMRSLVS